MRKTDPLEASKTWQYPLPIPMPGVPVCATEVDLNREVEKLSPKPLFFMWTDDQRRCINGYQFIPSVRQGVPPQGIEASIEAWSMQYKEAWLVVDLRDGVIPPSITCSLEKFLQSKSFRTVVLVSDSSDNEQWRNGIQIRRK